MSHIKATPTIIRLIMTHYHDLPKFEQIRLFRELAMILPTEQASAAEQAAFLLEKSEQQQMKLQALLQEGK